TNRKQKYDKSMYNDVFNFNKLLTQRQVQDGFVFTNTIQTDGVAINFHFRRPNLVISEPKTLDRTDPNIRVIAQDPGRVTLFCGVEELDNGKYRNYKLSRKQFYTDTGIRKAVKKTNKWNIESPELRATLDQLSQTSSRSNRLHEFFEYVKIVKNNEDILWNEYTKQRYARQRFALYSGKKSVYDKFFHSIVADDPTKKIVIAFGDAGFASTSKHELSAPTTTLEKQCAKWFNIVKIDEFRTTKLHYATGKVLSKVYEKTTTIVNNTIVKTCVKSVRGLLWYNTTNNGKFIDRDFNAALNILKCYRFGKKRPSGMSRADPRQDDPPIHYINKIIRIVVVPEQH